MSKISEIIVMNTPTRPLIAPRRKLLLEETYIEATMEKVRKVR